MGYMKNLDLRIRQGGDDAIAAVSEYVKELEGEVASARACAEMMLQGTGQKLGEELARRVMDEHYPPRWIPVDEMLPEEGVDVLWMVEAYGVRALYKIGWRHGDSIHADDGIRYCITRQAHWQPLPSPPDEAT